MAVSPWGGTDDPYPKAGRGLVMYPGGRMLIALTVLGRTVVELRFGSDPEPATSVEQGPPHIEDHTGYSVGFVPPSPVPLDLDMPDRE